MNIPGICDYSLLGYYAGQLIGHQHQQIDPLPSHLPNQEFQLFCQVQCFLMWTGFHSHGHVHSDLEDSEVLWGCGETDG